MALVGEVICRCGSTLIGQDGRCKETEREQVICLVCKNRYDKELAFAAQDENVNVVLKHCAKGCKERMVKIHGGANGKMKCPECGAEERFET